MMRSIAIACSAGIAFAALMCAPSVNAQTLGTVSVDQLHPFSCPTARGFATSDNSTLSSTCYNGTVTNCPGDDDLAFIVGVAGSGGLKGTIVMFDGGNGQHAAWTPEFIKYMEDYVAAGYQVVELAWGTGTSGGSGNPWEQTAIVQGSTNTSYNIERAACRPASFLNWVRYNGFYSGGGMCAHGRSAGSGAVAYALAWYGASSYLDKVVLEDGPVFSDIYQGCEISSNGANGQVTEMCWPGQNQIGCKGAWISTGQPPIYPLEYVAGDQGAIENWTGNPVPACANNSSATSPAEQTLWQSGSIVYTVGTQQPSFNYPSTAISAWLCAGFLPGVTQTNAGAEGELFYLQFTNTSQVKALTVNAITQCPVSEGVENGVPPPYTGYTGPVNTDQGLLAVVKDMTAGYSSVGQPACSKLH